MRALQVTIIALVLVLVALPAIARDVEVFIAPRSAVIPASGKVVFDIYWTNHGVHSEAIPPRGGAYAFAFSSLDSDYGGGGNVSAANEHAGPNRWLSPRTVIHDQLTVDIGLNRKAPLTEVSAHFRGLDCKFDSNTVILRNSAQ